MFPSRRIATLGGDKFRDDYSLAFDGTNDYIDCGDSSDWNFSNGSASIFSVSVWFKSADGTPASNDTLVAKYDTSDNKREWRISTNASDKITIYVSSNGTATMNAYSSFVLADTSWHHVAFTYDGSVATAGLRPTIYVDGVDYGVTTTGTFPAILNEDDRPLVISCFTAAGSNSAEWNGNISEVAIYNSALTDSQVKTIYNGREPYNHKEGIATGNLKAWYRMGDGRLDYFHNVGTTGLIGDEVDPTMGEDLFDAGVYDSGIGAWAAEGTNTVENDSGAIKITYDNDADGARLNLSNAADLTSDLTVGKTYEIRFAAKINTSTANIQLNYGTGTYKTFAVSQTYYQYYRFHYPPTHATNSQLKLSSFGTGEIIYIKDISIRQIGGNAGAMRNMAKEDFVGDTP